MHVGINLPWYSNDTYGQDIGRALTAKRPASQPNPAQTGPKPKPYLLPSSDPDNYEFILDAQLASWKLYGIECVRWFLLADGVNLTAPKLDKSGWSFPVSDLVQLGHVDDFKTILKVFARQKMGLIPCLVSFDMFWDPVILLNQSAGHSCAATRDVVIPAGTTSLDDFVANFYADPKQKSFKDDTKSVDWTQFIKRGRGGILKNADSIRTFLTSTLQPLLDAANSQPEYAATIVAWDLMNEPEQVFQYIKDVNSTPASGRDVAAFLQIGLMMIWDAGFKATIGFQTALPFGLDDGYKTNHTNTDGMKSSVEAIRSQMDLGKWVGTTNFIVQVHFYGGEFNSEQTTLLQASAFKAGASPVMLGEFATLIAPVSSRVTQWGLISTQDSVTARLAVLESKGYDWALPWCALCGDPYTNWGNQTLLAIAAYGGPGMTSFP